jgi:hypothetical protein
LAHPFVLKNPGEISSCRTGTFLARISRHPESFKDMKTSNQAFTRIELLFCALGVGLLLIPAISLLASNKSESERVVCFNNLRQIGRAFNVWANDHDESYPWKVDQTEGGLLHSPLAKLLWFQFDVVSNQLGSPNILVCPSDLQTPAIADNWGNGPGGLARTGNQNNALSYFLALHASPYAGTSLLSGDRNLIPSANNVSCSFLPVSVCSQLAPYDPGVRWTNSVHGTIGHLLFTDGAVQFSTTPELQALLIRNRVSDNNSGVHYLGK